MRALIHRLSAKLAAFRREERAVAAVEFALIVPFLLTLYFGSMEASSLFVADRSVNTVSATVGDLVSQWDSDDGSIPVATMDAYFASAAPLMFPLSTTGLKQVVTCIQVNADGTTKVIWSKASGSGATARAVDSSYPLPAAQTMNAVARGGYLIASEAYYSYLPVLGQVFTTTLNLYRENIYMPRFGPTELITVS